MDSNIPLNALRCFASAARMGGFAGASTELGITASAVSQQIRILEKFLGKQLFLRNGNRVTLTEAGETLYPQLEVHLEAVSGALADLRERPRRARLVLSVSPSLAEHWLYEHFSEGELAASDIRAELDPVDILGTGVDLRITYGADLYPSLVVTPLYADQIVATCRPGFLDRFGGAIEQLPDRSFIHMAWGPYFANNPSWRVWFGLAGHDRNPDPAAGMQLHLNGQAIAAAIAGVGIALIPQQLVARHIKEGRLEIAHPTRMPMESSYCAYTTPGRISKPAVKWLLQRLTQSG